MKINKIVNISAAPVTSLAAILDFLGDSSSTRHNNAKIGFLAQRYPGRMVLHVTVKN